MASDILKKKLLQNFSCHAVQQQLENSVLEAYSDKGARGEYPGIIGLSGKPDRQNTQSR